MTRKYTPGPWSVGDHLNGHYALPISRQDGLWVAGAYATHTLESPLDNETVANATLIASAPDLADALGVAYEILQLIPLSSLAAGRDDQPLVARVGEAIRDARAALIKAGVRNA